VSGDAYLHDLERCARRVYELRSDLADWRARTAIDLLFDRDRRLVIGLVSQLLASIALIPWLGAGIVLAGLALLYVGALASAAWTITRMQQARQRERLESVEQAVRRAIATCPPLDAGAGALVIRLANLTAILPTPRSVAMMQATLRDVSSRPELRSWPFLNDVADLVTAQNSRTLLSLHSS
jgi:hypothetical protein